MFVDRVDIVKLLYKLKKVEKVLLLFICVCIFAMAFIFLLLSNHLIQIRGQQQYIVDNKNLIF